MKIRTQINCKIVDKWTIVFYDEDGLINLCAIPPTTGDRVDILLQTIINSNNLHKESNYIYNHKGSLKKLKGEKIIIRIKSGLVKMEYKNR